MILEAEVLRKKNTLALMIVEHYLLLRELET